MLTQLATVKSRLGLELDPTWDNLLLRAIMAVSARFDLETNRSLTRSEDAISEFAPEDREILVSRYPIERILKFEIKTSEASGWVEQTGIDYLIRKGCIITLATTMADLQPSIPLVQPAVARVHYSGGYLLPGDEPVVGATPLPPDLEQAAIEQTAFWFQTRDKLGLLRQWPKGGSYEQFADTDLLPSLRETLGRYTRVVW